MVEEITGNVNMAAEENVTESAKDIKHYSKAVTGIEQAIARRSGKATEGQEKALKKNLWLLERARKTHARNVMIVDYLCQNNEGKAKQQVIDFGFTSPTSLHPTDIKGLPKELVAQLNISESDQQEMYLLDLIERGGGEMGLDNLIVAIYLDNAEITERAKLTGKIYRMINKGLLYAMPGKKAIYSTSPYEKSPESDDD